MSTPTKSPRTRTPHKQHCCTKCGEPMKGHKRNQCGTPTKNDSSPKPASGSRRKSLSPIDAKMKALEIGTPERDERERMQRRRSSVVPPPRPETLVSLSSNDKAVLEVLAKPGMLSTEGPEEEKLQAAGNIQKWLNDVPPPTSPRKARRSRAPSDEKPAIDTTQEIQDAVLFDTARSTTPRPKGSLQRTYSAKEMDDLLQSLEERSTQPTTQVYRIPAADVEELKKRAMRCKLFVRGAIPEKGDGWVVVGADKAAVEEVCDRVANEERRERGGLGGVLKPGLVGAAITWLALAYS